MKDYFQSQFKSGLTYIVAVSGGVDSVVLLKKISQIPNIKVIVAHFDHQIRGQSSTNDAELVKQLAQKYNYKYELLRGGLGKSASEDQARQARYRFLRTVAKEHQGQLVVAHHFDDIIETIAINIERGTGWQGLAVMGAEDIIRPMINLTKGEIIAYAKQNNLVWHEDETNSNNKYLRNRLRQMIKQKIPYQNRLIIFDYFWRQKSLKRAIWAEADKFYQPKGVYDRYFWIMIDYRLAVELLRILIKRHFNISIITPQAEQAIIAIKTAQNDTIYQVGEGVILKLTTDKFTIKNEPCYNDKCE